MVMYLTDKIIAHFRKSTTDMELVAISNKEEREGSIPAIEYGDRAVVGYDSSNRVYILITLSDRIELSKSELTNNQNELQRLFRIDDDDPLYVKVEHIGVDDKEMLSEDVEGVSYVMLFVNSNSEYGTHSAIYKLEGTSCIKPVAERLLKLMFEKNPTADEGDIRYFDLPEILDVNIDIAEYMIPMF